MATRELIEERVFVLLRERASKDISGVSDARMPSLFMARDLGLARTARGVLAPDYSEISRSFGGRAVPREQAELRIKVKTVVDLVLERANA